MGWQWVEDGSAEAKAAFHKKYKRELSRIAAALGLPRGSYDVRSTLGGTAVLGEVTLHAEKLYLQVGGTFWEAAEPTGEVLFRTCEGRKDYAGGFNQWTTLAKLDARDESLMATLRRIVRR